MVDVIAKYRGTVNEIEGDGILAFFGAPLVGDDDVERAIACAISMQIALNDFNKEQRSLALPELSMGIGINTGEVVVGNIGSTKRAKYGAIGSAINTAYRVESYTVGGQILISPGTYEQVKSVIEVKDRIEVQFKGIETPVTLYDIVGIKGRYKISLPQYPTSPLKLLAKPVKVSCYLLKGKTVSKDHIPAYLISIANMRADIILEQSIDPLTNIKVDFHHLGGSNLPSAYAKVLSVKVQDSDKNRFRAQIEFTYLADEIKRFLEIFEKD
jgi:adenylate cyclase